MPRKKPEDLVVEPKAKVEEVKPDAEIKVPATSETMSKKVKLDLEVDTTVKDLGPNPYVKIIHMARAVDAWRIFPRVFITTYIYLLYKVVLWYMALPSPTMEQSGLVSIVVGAGAAWFGLYTGSRSKK
tara:strand:- start:5780 stop:6163 length:384 start_codon:yes stop_codon:yes gene_type:complete